MIDPKPVDSATRSKPSKILSKENLFQAWDSSRDSTSRAGSPGTDNGASKLISSHFLIAYQEHFSRSEFLPLFRITVWFPLYWAR